MNKGVYKITNIANGKFYIGSTNNFPRRKRDHFSTLKYNTHKSVHLQRSYNKYGISNFKFDILVRCPEEYLLKLEQWFMDNLKPEYNIYKVALSNKRGKPPFEHQTALYKTRVHSEETRRRISEANKGKKLSAAHKVILLKAITGKKKSEEAKKKLSDYWKGYKWSKERNEKVSRAHLGSRNHQTKLTEDNVLQIKKNIYCNIQRGITLEQFGITNAIYDTIKTGKSWSHIIYLPTGNEIINLKKLSKKGVPRKSLTVDQVIRIKKLLHENSLSIYKIRTLVRVNQKTVEAIRDGITWKHINLESVR